MSSLGKVAVLAVAMVVILGPTFANVIPLQEEHSLDLKTGETELAMDDFYKLFMDYFMPPTVGHFATHNLCRRLRKPFEAVLKQKLQSMSDSFVKKFVDNLCDKKPHVLLKLWVAELFDADGNGYVEDHEKYSVIDHNFDD